MAMIVDEPEPKVCDHVFERHVAAKVFGSRGTAWLQPHMFAPGSLTGQEQQMQVCVLCGEQGYEVPA